MLEKLFNELEKTEENNNEIYETENTKDNVIYIYNYLNNNDIF